MLALALAALLAQCEDSGVAVPGFVEGCAAGCTALTVSLPVVQPGDVMCAVLGVDGMTSAVDGGTFWQFRALQRSAPSQFSGWLFFRIAEGTEPAQWTFALTGVGTLGASAVVTGHSGVAIAASESLLGQQTDPPRAPMVNVQTGDRVVDFFATDTSNPDAGWVAPAGTCGRKLRGRVAYVDQRTTFTGQLPSRTTSQPVVDAPTAAFSVVLRGVTDAGPADAGTTDAGTTDAGTTDAGTTDAGTTDAGAADAGTADAGTTDAGTSDAGTGPTDGGTTEGPRTLNVGCGCGSSAGGVFPALFVVLLARKRRRAVLAALLLGSTALGQVVTDDFETGNLNAWTPTACGSQSLTSSTLAAHRGQRGLRLEDTATNESCPGAHVQQPLPKGVRDVYSRMWVRLTQRNPDGDSIILHAGLDPSGGAAHSWQIDYQNQLKAIEQPQLVDGGDGYHAALTPRGLRDGGWALLEACTLNRGATNATAIYAVDGIELTRTSFSAVAPAYAFLAIGEVYSSSTFTGIVDFDDVRADTRPQASRLVLSAGALKSNTCAPVTVALAASLPASDAGVGPAPLAPYAVAPTLTGTTFFRDDACRTEETAAEIAKGANAVTLFVRPPAIGALTLTAAHPDFLPATLDTGVTDGGVGGSTGPKSLYAMGCSATEASPLLLLALLFLLSRPSSRTS